MAEEIITENNTKPVSEKLKPIDGYVLRIERNTENGYYEVVVGIPINWEYITSKTIMSDLLNETENGKIYKVYSKDEDIVIDDLFDYISEIVKSNEQIEQIQRELEDELANKRKKLEAELAMIYETFENKKNELLGKLKTENQEAKPVRKAKKIKTQE